ncbi:MAG: hypothetical protein PHF86_01430 [Candidatus Nanoarchaeia archaeon]|nr:hypothetical protein [Candidatus Nanoarchaeia archaeon]
MEVEKLNNNWKLKSIDIQFKKGYNFEEDPEKQKDRYEGMIKFENDESESFSFKIKPDMANKYIGLIAQDIVTAATGLGERLKESLGL